MFAVRLALASPLERGGEVKIMSYVGIVVFNSDDQVPRFVGVSTAALTNLSSTRVIVSGGTRSLYDIDATTSVSIPGLTELEQPTRGRVSGQCVVMAFDVEFTGAAGKHMKEKLSDYSSGRPRIYSAQKMTEDGVVDFEKALQLGDIIRMQFAFCPWHGRNKKAGCQACGN